MPISHLPGLPHTAKELYDLVSLYRSLSDKIDEWDSEPDSPRKDSAVSVISEERAIITNKLRDIYNSENYPIINETRFWAWLGDKIKLGIMESELSKRVE